MVAKRNLKLNSNFWNQTPSVGALATIYQARILLPPFRILYREAMTPQLNFIERAVPNLPDGLRYQRELISRPLEAALVARVGELPFKEFEFHGFKGKRRVVSFGWQYEFSGRGGLRKASDIPEFLRPLRAFVASFGRLDPEALQQVSVIEYGPGAGIGWHRDKPVFGEVLVVSLLAPCMLRFRRKVINGSDSDRISGWSRNHEVNSRSDSALLKTKSEWHDKYRTGSGSDRVKRKRRNEISTGSDSALLKTKPGWDDKYKTGSDSDRVERKRGNEVTTGSDRDQLKAKPEWDEKYRTGSESDRLNERKPRHSSQWDRINLLAEPRSAYHLIGPARSEWEHSILRVDALRYSITFRTLREE